MRFLDNLKKSKEFGDQVVWHEQIPPKPAATGRLDVPLMPVLENALKSQGIKTLFSHQAEAINLIRQGKSVVTATPTASGKSLIYNLPVFEAALKDPSSRALYIFPLKALEQDQLKAVRKLSDLVASGGEVNAEVYDGDTSPYRRKKIREKPPQILITNPDMLHLSMLAFHDSWAEFLRNLKFIVIDEIHTYRGIFGSHIAQIIKRLHRVLAHYQADPVFILSSATIGNPAEFAQSLTGLDCPAITDSGAPTAGKHFLFINPDSNTAVTASRIFVWALKDGLRTIAFTQSRRLTELMHTWALQMAPEVGNRLSSYRAGFLASERREIETKLANGELLGVISTSALELGLDIGALEICLLIGYPGSIVRTWQRGGRVGRSEQESAILMLAQPDALDQYFMRHPKDFFNRGFEPAVLDPDNEPITLAHLACAASEIPLDADDEHFRPHERKALMTQALSEGLLLLSAEGKHYYPARRRPHRDVNIRTSGTGYVIVAEGSGQVIGGIDSHKVFKECHPGAIYSHRATTWVITDLDLDRHNAHARKTKVDYYTRPKAEKNTEILEVLAVKPVGNFLAKLGRLRVREKVIGFEKRLIRGQELVGTYDLDLPETVFETEGLWFEMEDFVRESLEPGQHFMGGIHAIEHAGIGLFPLVALCDRDDMGGISYPMHPELGKGAVFIYDGHAGGVGLARRGYEVILELLTQTLELIDSCPCEDGCPSCIHSPKCGSGNKPLDKASAVSVLEILLGKRQIKAPTETGKEEPTMDIPKLKNKKEAEPRIAVFDTETLRSAADVGGWNNAHLMGLAAGVVYDTSDEKYHVYEEHQAGDLVNHLLEADLIIGFNQLKFDFKVMSAYTPKKLADRPNLDLLVEVHQALGRRISLNNLGWATLDREKTADGLQSLEWVKEGRMDKVIEYCKQDVRLTWELYEFARDNGYLLFEDKQGVRLRVPLDLDLKKYLDN